MEINEMLTEDIEKRSLEIEEEIKNGGDVEALTEEVEKLEARKAEIKREAEERKALLDSVAKAEPVEEIEKEGRKVMSEIEIRNSKEYIDAYAEYIKTGRPEECRAILKTENASGLVAVPEFVYDIVKTAWEKDGIMSLVRKTYLRGNLKINFEVSGTDAAIHTEGAAAVSAEDLVLGLVELKPQSIKKLVQVTDEINDLRGEEYLRYIYEEIAYRIAKKAADTLLGKITAAGTTATTGAPGVPVITSTTIGLGLVAQAMAQLSAEAENPVVIMNRQTWGAFKAAQAAASYAYDPFEGLPVLFNNSLTAFSAATTGVAYAIVGDLGHGALANFPNGNEIEFKVDPMTKKDQDIIEVLGREYVGLGVVADKAFCVIKH
jgi:HK97 family phage major capsid protein